jgi:hypothetical protein
MGDYLKSPRKSQPKGPFSNYCCGIDGGCIATSEDGRIGASIFSLEAKRNPDKFRPWNHRGRKGFRWADINAFSIIDHLFCAASEMGLSDGHFCHDILHPYLILLGPVDFQKGLQSKVGRFSLKKVSR